MSSDDGELKTFHKTKRIGNVSLKIDNGVELVMRDVGHVFIGPGEYIRVVSEELNQALLVIVGQSHPHIGGLFRPFDGYRF